MPFRLLFVCSGNTCRSPLAEALARTRTVSAESAGVAAQKGDGAAPYAVRVLRTDRGLDLSDHVPRDVDALDLDAFDRIVAMDPTVAQRLRIQYEVNPDALVTWSIPDPYGGTLADYRYCLEQIDAALDRLLDE
jgi:protein-tyrosine phosphatase